MIQTYEVAILNDFAMQRETQDGHGGHKINGLRWAIPVQ